MIVKTSMRKSLWSLIVYLRVELTFATVFSSLVYYLYEHKDLVFLASLNFVPVSFFGTILSVFLAFRNNNSYSRWWEARQLWGDLVNSSRFFKSQLVSLLLPTSLDTDNARDAIPAMTRRELLHRHIAYINLLRMQLRGNIQWRDVEPLLSGADLADIRAAANPASRLVTIQARQLQELANRGHLTDYRLIAIREHWSAFTTSRAAANGSNTRRFPGSMTVSSGR